MALLYADEQFPLPLTRLIREFGHDVLTVQESGNAGLPDPDVLEFAILQERAVLTQNRRDFKRLHRLRPDHAGMIVCTEDRNLQALATRIDRAIETEQILTAKLISVVRPAKQT
jgi:predicted nuclease of predicted toxin-antitoxin system